MITHLCERHDILDDHTCEPWQTAELSTQNDKSHPGASADDEIDHTTRRRNNGSRRVDWRPPVLDASPIGGL